MHALSTVVHMETPITDVRGMTLIESVTALAITAILTSMVVTIGTSLMDSQRARLTEDDLAAIYAAIVGNPKQNAFGYLGDVGDYPSSLADLVAPDPVPPGWNGPYLSGARLEAN